MSFVQKQILQLQQSPMVKKYEEALKTFHNLMSHQREPETDEM